MHDEREGIPIAFAQCGCSTTEWKIKQLECTPARYSGYLSGMHPWAAYYFCPLHLRKSSTEWHFRSDLGGSIVVDRGRMMNFFVTNNDLEIPDFVEPIFDMDPIMV